MVGLETPEIWRVKVAKKHISARATRTDRATALSHHCPMFPSHPATTPNLVGIGSETPEIWHVKCSGKHIFTRLSQTARHTTLLHHCPESP